MPGVIDPGLIHVDTLPTIWSPVQTALTDEERVAELEDQATASLLWSANAPEAILRLLLGETEIERILLPPQGYDEDQQGEWDPTVVTFAFKRPIRLEADRMEAGDRILEYKLDGAGHWRFQAGAEGVSLERI